MSSSSPAPITVAARPVGGVAGNCQPDYPPAARRREEQGLALIHVTVSAGGRAVAASLVQSSGHALLDSAALAKVMRDCRFLPATRNGVPIEGDTLQGIEFHLEQ